MFFCIWHDRSIAPVYGRLIPMKAVKNIGKERGGGDYGWLTSRYSFSFNDWYDETKMGFGALRVLNDDEIAEGQGFGAHGHRDMEIVTIVTHGAVLHEDNIGNSYVVHEGDVQVMSAGTGVMHSEHNNSSDDPLSLFQIWIVPREKNTTPRYDQKHFSFNEIKNDVLELVGPSSLIINQDAYISYGALDKNADYRYKLHNPSHGLYVFVIKGSLKIEEYLLEKRDALGVEDAEQLEIQAAEDVQFLIIEVPMK